MLDRLVPGRTKAAALQKMLLDQVREALVGPSKASAVCLSWQIRMCWGCSPHSLWGFSFVLLGSARCFQFLALGIH